ncbi:sigma-54-dependent Fis family transcriptional regulator [Inhella proteolytica]|uniref:Sigma-54-dependent Fis family transcriptional regulator n=1 Tax=Inhella proteolytica TaxID=2795029 RepID=A0A931IX24_9BURK|nr:sigma-54-dependent Fis family transcriptional regulator [Inhella proteolytica]MBH9575301.1 sigma-54-dependent Fis family transcriptional regulator [Inhella proteolytica]
MAALDAGPPAQHLALARRQLEQDGQLGEGLLHPLLAQSWRRSRAFGLEPLGAAPAAAPHASAAQLARARAASGDLLAQARPVLEFVQQQVQGSSSLVILADAQGTLLEALGDDGFADRAARVALRPGASWHEQWRGTNAIGTALAEGQAVLVRGGEHYLPRNGFLSCAAAPIHAPDGRLLGVLDISGERRRWHPHTLGLARAAARMVEQRLFATRCSAPWLLALHEQAEGLGSVAEGRLALDEDGLLAAADRSACAALGLAAPAPLPLAELLELGPDTLAEMARDGRPRRLRHHQGRWLWLQVQRAPRLAARASPALPPAAPATPQDALAALDSGDPTMHALIQRARRLLDRGIPLLLQGETGTGKEWLAQALHASSARRHKPFVALNCAALPEGLIEAELFGYQAGAFTGAAPRGAPGRIREAQGGTLFLDEVGDMPLALQARLLRVLQDQRVQPLGGGSAQAVDFQLLCASHRQLPDEVQAGRFRADLYYRIAGQTLALPPLRQRSDFDALAARMLRELAGADAPQLAPEVADALRRRPWPGNLRELHHVLRGAWALLEPGEREIGWAHLGAEFTSSIQPVAQAMTAALSLRAVSDQALRQALEDCGGNRTEAARRLGISRSSLYRRLAA